MNKNSRIYQLAYTSEQSGNAFLYVLIAVVLFAALYFAIGSQNDSSETQMLDKQRVKFAASEIIDYSSQAESSLRMMEFSGIELDKITFYTYDKDEFDNGTETYIYMLHHPDGGGLDPGNLPVDIIVTSTHEDGQEAGWYLGKFNNIEWSKTSADDVVAVAYKIKKTVCEQINKTLTGDTTIPAMPGEVREFFNEASSETTCLECDEKPALCVSDSSVNVFAYYSILASL